VGSSASFQRWLQRQHGIGALLLPLFGLIILALALLLNQPTSEGEAETPFRDYPLDTGAPEALAPSSEPPPRIEPPTPPNSVPHTRPDRPSRDGHPPLKDLGPPAGMPDPPAAPGAE